MTSILLQFGHKSQKIHVLKRSKAMLYNGYALLNTDSIFEFNHNRYLIKNTEYFDSGENISYATIWTAMGYENWTNENMSRFKDFLNTHEFSNHIEVAYIDARHIKVNLDTGLIKSDNKAQKVIYYTLVRDQNPYGIKYIHILTYR